MERICIICKTNKNVKLKRKTKTLICKRCYDNFFLIKKKCDLCWEYNLIKLNHGEIKICQKCYKVLNPGSNRRPLRKCLKCNKLKKAARKVSNGHICHSCYEPPKKKCSKCGETNIIQTYIGKLPICNICYRPPKKICYKCGNKDIVKKNTENGPICQKCYEFPQVICHKCGNTDRAFEIEENGPICHRCYDAKRALNSNIKILGLLRKRLRDALQLYSKYGKIKKADEYGINYGSIIEHLTPFPDNIEEYHIDHILPLSAFDLNNPIHIKAAFAPENHQWLKAEENLKKHNKYDPKHLIDYLKKFK